MITKDDFGFRSIWDAILEVYQEFAKICDSHGLRYYVTDGTAIGAVRHKGFIPWDDDFDVSMPREDYERFIELSKTELPPHLKFVNWKNTPEMTLLFGKIQDSRRERVEEIEKKCGRMLSNGVYIDLFPIDGYPDSKLEVFFTKRWAQMLSCIIRFRGMRFSQQTSKGKLVWLAGLFFNVLMPWATQKWCLEKCEHFLLKHPFATAKNTGRASLRVTMLNRKPLPKEVWGMARMQEFHDRMVPLPADVDAYLHSLYGDYMKLPPEDKRKPGHSYAWRCPWWLGPTMG